jgi:hypothetical protein
MKPIICSFLIVSAALALGGCSGGTPVVPGAFSSGPRTENSLQAAAFGEVLKSSKVVVKKGSCIQDQSGNASFSANGTASGPYKGKFTVGGSWSFFKSSGKTFWTFAESFKIKGAHPITGTVTGNGTGKPAACATFGPVSGLTELQYHLGMAKGAATTNLIKNGGNLLQRLH